MTGTINRKGGILVILERLIMLKFRSNIRKARPNYRLVNPTGFWIMLGFVFLNVCLAVAIAAVPDVSDLAVYKVFPQDVMAALFGLIAILMALSIAMNAWRFMRLTLGLGLFIKVFYGYSLIELGFRTTFVGILGVTSLWLFVAMVQFLLVVYFLPTNITTTQNGALKNGNPESS